jgi:hypothetical protein
MGYGVSQSSGMVGGMRPQLVHNLERSKVIGKSRGKMQGTAESPDKTSR